MGVSKEEEEPKKQAISSDYEEFEG